MEILTEGSSCVESRASESDHSSVQSSELQQNDCSQLVKPEPSVVEKSGSDRIAAGNVVHSQKEIRGKGLCVS